MRKVLSGGKWFALVILLSVIAISMANGAPVRARGGGAKLQAQVTLQAPETRTGAAALFGIDEGALLSYDDNIAALAAGSGANLTRTEVNWSTIEAQRGTYDFTVPDAALGRLVAHGFTPVVYVSSNPTWATDLPCAPIDSKDAAMVTSFANLMGALADRYPDVKVWGLYNEPDSPFGDEGSTSKGCMAGNDLNDNNVADYKDYAFMLKTGWKAVHDANPTALMATGALAFDNFNGDGYPSGYPGSANPDGFSYNFTTNLFNYMGATYNQLPAGDKYIDLVMFNYYEVYGTEYWSKYFKGYGIQAKANALRSKMLAASFPAVDLLVTETGEYSLDSFVDPEGNVHKWIGPTGQARCMTITMTRGAAAALQGIVWWTFRDYASSLPFPQKTWKYGIVDQNLNIKQSYTALLVLATELNNYNFKKSYSGKKGYTGIESYLFTSGKSKKYVLWSSTYTPVSDQPPVDCAKTRNNKKATIKAKTISIMNYVGGSPKIIQDNKKGDKDKTLGTITIAVGSDPKIVQVNPTP